MGLAGVLFFCCLLILHFQPSSTPSYSTFASGNYEHGKENSVNNEYQSQSINNMKELSDGDLRITNSQPSSTIYVLRGGGGGGGRGRGGRSSSSSGNGRSNGAASNNNNHRPKKSTAPLSWNKNPFRLFTTLGFFIFLALVL